MQLTWAALQDRADTLGGCWRPEINVRVGLELFAGHLTKTADAPRAYSLFHTGSMAPSAYAADAMRRAEGWQKVIDAPSS